MNGFLMEKKGLIPLQVGLLNVDGYKNSLLSFMDNAVDEGFLTPAARYYSVCPNCIRPHLQA